MNHDPIDHARARRESLRWYLLLAIYHARPSEICDSVLESTLRSVYPDLTAMETRQQIDYLAHRELVQLRKQPSGRWWSELTSTGTDVVEYTVDCDPGIARPVKYWAGE